MQNKVRGVSRLQKIGIGITAFALMFSGGVAPASAAQGDQEIPYTLWFNNFENGASSDNIEAVVSASGATFRVLAKLPIENAAIGGEVPFNVSIKQGEKSISWDAFRHSGTLTLLEPLSYVDVAKFSDAPEIDGEIDGLWETAAQIETNKQVFGENSATAKTRLGWTGAGDKLYVLAEVTDSNIDVSANAAHEQDSVEIFLDLGNSKSGA